MPWKDTTRIEQKIEFICEWRTGKYTIMESCRSLVISRPTAYKIITRFEQMGYDGLREMFRTPREHSKETDQKVLSGILELKEKHRLWGAKKIRNDYAPDHFRTTVFFKNKYPVNKGLQILKSRFCP